jgi:hypothetical protein
MEALMPSTDPQTEQDREFASSDACGRKFSTGRGVSARRTSAREQPSLNTPSSAPSTRVVPWTIIFLMIPCIEMLISRTNRKRTRRGD